MKSGNLNSEEHFGPLQDYKGTALPLQNLSDLFLIQRRKEEEMI